MAPSPNSIATAAFLEAHRADLLARIHARAITPNSGVPRNLDDSPHLIEEWFDSQVEYLRTGRSRAFEWATALVNGVRARGGFIDEVISIVRALRLMLVESCSGCVDGVSDADLQQISIEIKDHLLESLATVYSETERRLASAERRRQRTIAEWMDRAFVTINSDGTIGLTNSLFAGLVGLAEDRLVGQDFSAFCDTVTAAEIRRALRQRRATNARTFDGVLLGQKGARISLRFWVLPMFDEEGLRSGVALAMTTADAFRAKVLEDLADTLGIGCYTIDETGRVISANALGRDLVSVGAEDTGAACCRRRLSPNGECSDCLRKRVFETGEPYRATVQFKSSAGDMRWVEITCVPVRGEQGAVTRVAKFVRDLTEQKLMEDQFLRQQRTSFVSQLAMTVAHQLRNPLGVMIGFAEMLSQGLPAEQVPMVLDRILRNGIRCKEIVQNLLEFGRGAPGEHVLADLNAIVCERVKSIYPGSVASRIQWRLAESLPLVECAPDQLAQVFINLIDNALSTSASKVLFETSVRDDSANPGNSANPRDSICIRVWDDGPGVPEELRSRIFEPFFTTRKEDGGIGLGLCLSRSVIQEHRGLLYLDEGASPGACFVIQLPAAQNVSTPEPEVRKPETARRPGHRVLIVEDETDLVFLLTMALQSHGHEIEHAVTGAQAVDLLQGKHYDAVVIDMLLADELGGRDLYQLLLQTNPELAGRSLFITGDTMKFETRRFLNEVKRPYMEKPFMISDFTRTVEGILEST